MAYLHLGFIVCLETVLKVSRSERDARQVRRTRFTAGEPIAPQAVRVAGSGVPSSTRCRPMRADSPSWDGTGGPAAVGWSRSSGSTPECCSVHMKVRRTTMRASRAPTRRGPGCAGWPRAPERRRRSTRRTSMPPATSTLVGCAAPARPRPPRCSPSLYWSPVQMPSHRRMWCKGTRGSGKNRRPAEPTARAAPGEATVSGAAARRSSIAEQSSSQPWNGCPTSSSSAMYPAIGVASRSRSMAKCVTCPTGASLAAMALPVRVPIFGRTSPRFRRRLLARSSDARGVESTAPTS